MISEMAAVVLFVHDLSKCTAFYRDTFKLPHHNSDDDSASFLLGKGLYLILLSPSGAADLLDTQVNQDQTAKKACGLLAAGVTDVDAAYTELTAQGVTFIRPPTNQTWGLRTAHFVDPEGNVWEINQSLASQTKGEVENENVANTTL